MQRIHRLLYPEGPNTAWTPMLAAVILIATAGISAAAWRSQSSVPAAGQKQESATSYSRWLNEDVVYIIEDGERAAFQKLTTDKDRDRFIEQFWERRNPAPDLAENAFKEEHYRGIEYANKHFTTVSGWQTDRGHIYIAYGPPDEIDWHPKDGSRAIGTDEWRFLHSVIGKDGYVTFIDQTGAGDYRLAPGE